MHSKKDNYQQLATPNEKPWYRRYTVEDYFTLVIFWSLLLVVFLQFFTRYVLRDSTVWTEEIARYLLIVIGFIGSATAVRKGEHIAVNFLHRYLSTGVLKWLFYLISMVELSFYGYLSWLTFKLSQYTTGMMVSIDVPKYFLYYLVFAGWLLMTFRGVQRLLNCFLKSNVFHQMDV